MVKPPVHVHERKQVKTNGKRRLKTLSKVGDFENEERIKEVTTFYLSLEKRATTEFSQFSTLFGLLLRRKQSAMDVFWVDDVTTLEKSLKSIRVDRTFLQKAYSKFPVFMLRNDWKRIPENALFFCFVFLSVSKNSVCKLDTIENRYV